MPELAAETGEGEIRKIRERREIRGKRIRENKWERR